MIINLKKYGTSARVCTTRQKPQNPRFCFTVNLFFLKIHLTVNHFLFLFNCQNNRIKCHNSHDLSKNKLSVISVSDSSKYRINCQKCHDLVKK